MTEVVDSITKCKKLTNKMLIFLLSSKKIHKSILSIIRTSMRSLPAIQVETTEELSNNSRNLYVNYGID
jgi:hypothetical protein